MPGIKIVSTDFCNENSKKEEKEEKEEYSQARFMVNNYHMVNNAQCSLNQLNGSSQQLIQQRPVFDESRLTSPYGSSQFLTQQRPLLDQLKLTSSYGQPTQQQPQVQEQTQQFQLS